MNDEDYEPDPDMEYEKYAEDINNFGGESEENLKGNQKMKRIQIRAVIKASLNADTEKEAISIHANALKQLREATPNITWDISKCKIKILPF